MNVAPRFGSLVAQPIGPMGNQTAAMDEQKRTFP
jgi:hypothetical protein